MKKIYLLLILVINSYLGYSQSTDPILVAIGSNNVTSNATPSSSGTINFVEAKGVTRGAGVASTGAVDESSYRTIGWESTNFEDAVTNNEYLEWSISASQYYNIDFSGMELWLSRTSNGPTKFKVAFSKDNFLTNTVLGTDKNLTTTAKREFYVTPSKNYITTGESGKITVRLYAWGATDPDGEILVNGNPAWMAHGIAQPGIIIKGTVAFQGLVFNDGTWAPSKPTTSTSTTNVLVKSGVYNLGNSTNIKTKNLVIYPEGSIVVPPTSSITVTGNLRTSDNLTLESTSNRFSSLIVSGTVTGNANYKRFVNIRGVAGEISNNDLISAPVSGQVFSDFAAANPNIVRNLSGSKLFFGPFEKSSGTYVTWAPDSNELLMRGVGYRAAVSGTTGSTVTFSGKVNTGTINIPIYKSGPAFTYWNLIGNPYTSHLNLNDFLLVNGEAMDPEAFAVYGHNGKNALVSDPWTTWNFNSIDEAEKDLRLTPGQGFFVSSASANETITFTSAMTHTGRNGDDDFIVGRPSSTINKGSFKLLISNDTKVFKTEFYFNGNSSRGLDPGYDASIYGKKAPEFSVYSHLVENNKGSDMAIQSLAFSDLSSDLRIPIGVNASTGHQLVLAISEMKLPEGTEIYLEDNVNNSFTLISDSEYVFKSTSKVEGTGRFFLHISNRSLSIPEAEVHGLSIYTTTTDKVLHIKGLIKEQTEVKVYDVQGRLITTSQLKTNTNSNLVDMSSFNSGIYVVELKNNSVTKTQKVILN